MSNNKLSKILTIVAAVIGVLGLILLIRVVLAGDEEVQTSAELQNSVVNPFINFAFFVLIVTAIIAVVFSVLNLVKHPKALKKSLISLVVLGVILAITYFTASGDVVTDFTGNVLEESKNPSTSKWVSALINFTGLLGLGGLVLVGLGIVRGMLK